MARKRKRLIVDCDGVMADFTTPALELIHRSTTERFTVEQINEHDIFKALGVPHLYEVLDDAVHHHRFCANLSMYDGVKDAIETLRGYAHVVCVTAPYDSPSWDQQRRHWLRDNLGFKKCEIVQTSGKHLIPADAFVDDNIDYLLPWKDEHTDGVAIIWDQPWNRNFNEPGYKRVYCWQDVIEIVKSLP